MLVFFELAFFLMVGAVASLATGVQFGLSDAHLLFGSVGALFGLLVWWCINHHRARIYLDWLRSGNLIDAPKLGGIWREITDRTRRLLNDQHKKLNTSNKRLDDFLSAIQVSPNGVILLDANAQIEWCNLTAANHFDLNPIKDISQHIVNLVRDPEFKAYLASNDYALGITISGKRGANSRFTKLALQLHPYGQGKKLLLSNDITAIEVAESMRRDFVANVSHEIRTPLTVLSGFIETMQTLELKDADRINYLNLMEKQAFRMQSLVSDLLTLSKLEGSPVPMADTWMRADLLLEVCRTEAMALNNLLHHAPNLDNLDEGTEVGVDIQFEVQPDLEIAGSQAELQSAMNNLVNNAIRYTPTGGRVRVSLQALDRGGAIFSVNDTGTGIAQEYLPRLTERFYRVDASRSRESGGTGLGLAIVKHVVQRHNGDLKISSTQGKGSTFSFVLPNYRVRLQDIPAVS